MDSCELEQLLSSIEDELLLFGETSIVLKKVKKGYEIKGHIIKKRRLFKLLKKRVNYRIGNTCSVNNVRIVHIDLVV